MSEGITHLVRHKLAPPEAGPPNRPRRAPTGGLLWALAAGVADSGTQDSPFDLPWNLRIKLDEDGTPGTQLTG